MSKMSLDGFTREAAGAVSRRASVFAMMGAAPIAAFAARENASAKNNNGNKARKKAKQKCERQGRQCRAFVIDDCGQDQACLDQLLPCCRFLARCQAGPGLACLPEQGR